MEGTKSVYRVRHLPLNSKIGLQFPDFGVRKFGGAPIFDEQIADAIVGMSDRDEEGVGVQIEHQSVQKLKWKYFKRNKNIFKRKKPRKGGRGFGHRRCRSGRKSRGRAGRTGRWHR